MNFNEIALKRQSCRSYDAQKNVEDEKINAILRTAILSPSACNGQPYRITVCTGDTAKSVSSCVTGLGMNKFAKDAPVLLVISEDDYVASAAFGARVKKNDFRSIDIGILSAYITAEACAQGLGSCILGWFDDEKIRKICDIDKPIRLVITIGYPTEGEVLRQKKRKSVEKLISFK